MAFILPAYCERLTDGAFAEPVNATTNLSFAISFALIVRRASFHQECRDLVLLLMASAILGTSIGSTLWHTIRSPLTLILDAAPLFSLLLLLFYALCHAIQPKRYALVSVALFFALELGLSLTVPSEFMNGSIRHLAAIVTLAGIVTVIQMRSTPILGEAWCALGLYGLAILFRSTDLAVCPSAPIGTHFLWHLLGGAASFFAYSAAASLRAQR